MKSSAGGHGHDRAVQRAGPLRSPSAGFAGAVRRPGRLEAAQRAAGWPRPARRPASGGFTLIELLSVIVIIGLLAVFLLPALRGSEDQVKAKLTKSRLAQLATLLESYEGRFGNYPPSRFDAQAGALPNQLNLGAEALVVALWSKGFEGGGALETDELINTDGDRAVRSLTDFPDAQLFELGDAWGNPIAYLRADDYDQEQVLLAAGEDGEFFESRLRASIDGATQRHERAGTFQLHSAGPDGEFGSEDDIHNFD
jgi:prepilin-type N-terminal cleavage/methylation domain-containing protein